MKTTNNITSATLFVFTFNSFRGQKLHYSLDNVTDNGTEGIFTNEENDNVIEVSRFDRLTSDQVEAVAESLYRHEAGIASIELGLGYDDLEKPVLLNFVSNKYFEIYEDGEYNTVDSVDDIDDIEYINYLINNAYKFEFVDENLPFDLEKGCRAIKVKVFDFSDIYLIGKF